MFHGFIAWKMDNQLKSWRPVIVLANAYQFRPGERIRQACRQSRMWLWCREGAGTLVIAARRIELVPGRWFLLPWGTPMDYQPHPRTPFHLAGVHWVPRHDPKTAVVFGVAHSPADALANDPARRDAPLGAWTDGVLCGDSSRAPGLVHLAEFIVARFRAGPPEADTMRTLAALLCDEVRRVVEARTALAGSPALERATHHALLHLAEPLNVPALAAAAGCSRATLVRLFRRETGLAPAAWLTRARVNRARELLCATSLPVHVIAARVGIPDPYYFSRVFRARSGHSPRAYRAALRPL